MIRPAVWAGIFAAALAVALISAYSLAMPTNSARPAATRILVVTPLPDRTQTAVLSRIETQTADLPTVYAVIKLQATEQAGHDLATWAATAHGHPMMGN